MFLINRLRSKIGAKDILQYFFRIGVDILRSITIKRLYISLYLYILRILKLFFACNIPVVKTSAFFMPSHVESSSVNYWGDNSTFVDNLLSSRQKTHTCVYCGLLNAFLHVIISM